MTLTCQRAEDQAQNESSNDDVAHAIQGNIQIEEVVQCKRGDDQHSGDNAGHVDGCSDILGVIQTFHLHLPYGEGKRQGSDEQKSLVAEQKPN